MKRWKHVLGAAMLVVAGQAWAGKDLSVDDAWVRESVPGQTTASVQLNLTSAKPGKLIEISSPWAKSGEMQRLYPSGGKIKAISVKNVRLARGEAVAFGERKVMLMLIGLKQPLKAGDQVPIVLTVQFSDGEKATIEVKAEVRALELSYQHYSAPEVHDQR